MSGVLKRMTLLVALILLVAYLMPAIHAQQDLYVHVVDVDGRPRGNVEVRVIREGFSRVFITNSTGHAVFKDLTSGIYTVEAIIRNVVVAQKVVEFPKEARVELVLKISSLDVTVLDTKEKPVQGVTVRIKDSGGRVSLSGATDEFGRAYFADVPYSSIEGIGNYTAEAFVDGISVGKSQFSVPETISVKLSAKLVNLNITVTNMEGKKVSQVSVTIRSGNFSKSLTGPDGFVSFRNIPSSDLMLTYSYTIEVTRTFVRTPITIYKENRSVTRDMALDVVASLGTLKLKVVDEDGKPVKGVNVIISHGLIANFTVLRTGANGTITLHNAPLSTPPSNVGDYTLMVFRGNTYVGKVVTKVMSTLVEETYVMKLSKIVLTVTDYGGIPLAGVVMKAKDVVSDVEHEWTTERDGRVELRILPGPYEVAFNYMGRSVHSSIMNLDEGNFNVKLSSVNYPVRVFVVDSLGNPISGLKLQASFNGERVFDGIVEKEGISLTVPYPGEFSVSIFTDDKILQRRIIQLTGPEELKIRIGDKLSIGGSLVDVTLVVQTITLVFFAASLSGLLYVMLSWWKGKIHKRPNSAAIR
ncbi:MAG: carboxypeptidase-like regulatory domain-containing protein [Nitrososphaerota archaeon]|nr:carboxypeptidase-like regulatory domain-containing protein [Aigarchaeota archaeon]MDW8076437.1 carboxypeptidase-like regulatory domain-containing protein [Nitrososphaerota archaeon]